MVVPYEGAILSAGVPDEVYLVPQTMTGLRHTPVKSKSNREKYEVRLALLAEQDVTLDPKDYRNLMARVRMRAYRERKRKEKHGA